ncbi:hypothetical protein OG365_02975 [Streptomyces sp. NBC_00853]|uniref:hypothetical protein n=1 Tax=Streptomyces sp. NBC_00853 TaxID=2903681 RepID=UPI0038732095|nr:hypothetical protein OG365_02975 [Streptomyces sp. NBC_00853]
MFWPSGSKVSILLQQIGHDERPVTHGTLDELPARSPERSLPRHRSGRLPRLAGPQRA